MVIVIDTREQRPYKFPGLSTISSALKTGDYSLLDMEHKIAIERKSKADAYSTIGQHRDRFAREMQRMAAMDYSAIVIECSLLDFLTPPKHSSLHPSSAINSLLAWEVRYGVHVHFAGSRKLGNTLTMRLLEKLYKQHKGERA